MRVKICGITNLKDALYAVECGADALGFVFYEKSPRYISVEDARAIADSLPPFVELVGLFVNRSVEDIDEISAEAGMTLAQIHFDIDEQFLDDISVRNLPVVRAKSPEDIGRFSDRYRLVDAYCEEYGGSGKRLNLEWFDGVDCSKIILAGGLTPENLSEVKRYGFYGVDVSSATEMTKGIKDPLKVKKFIENAKSI
ncbi:Phosphoribosylanthranilate isomerase [hydrothermal vent metagenome]|uniref:phosphoribosylanthranilate isomerase n=1 Tax=hydrothermal vent metagenome TaxID=652676 RepID=A0A1W1C128_9ZZZZ